LTDDEIAAATLPKGSAEIVSFVPATDRDRYVTEDVRQVRPKGDKGRVLPAVARSFALLTEGMKARGVVALIRFVQRGPARYGLLDSDGWLSLIYTSDAVRTPMPMPDESFTDAELGLVGQLIDAVGVGTPILLDSTASQVQAHVDGKAAGVAPAETEKAAPVIIDLVAQLQASIDAVKAGKAEAAEPVKPVRKTRARKVA
jgi:non-homologous end joining protein Ku